MRNKRPWFKKVWKDHASEKTQADTRKNITASTGDQKGGARKKYVIAAAMSAAVLLLAAIPATYSYLTASSDTVVNTFAGGAISLTLDEADVDTDGNPTDDPRVQENSYKVIPGATLYKDPTVAVLSGSEVCYVYLYVENPLDEDYFTLDYSSDWKAVATTGTKTLYVYKSTVDASEGDVELTPIFTTVTVSDELTSEQIEAMGEVQIKVQAYAVQAEGVDSATATQMAADYFEEEFGFAWTDVDTAVDIDGLITEEEDDSEDTEEADTSSDTADEDSSADETDSSDTTNGESSSDETGIPDTSASDGTSDGTDTSDAGSDGTSSDGSSSDDAAPDSSDSSGSDVSTESTDSLSDSATLDIIE